MKQMKFEFEGDDYIAFLDELKDDSGTDHLEVDRIEDIYGSHIEPDGGLDDDENDRNIRIWEHFYNEVAPWED